MQRVDTLSAQLPSLSQDEIQLLLSWRRARPTTQQRVLRELCDDQLTEKQPAAELQELHPVLTDAESREAKSPHAPRKHRTSSSEDESSRKMRVGFQPRSDFRKKKNPTSLIPCAVAVMQRTPVGHILGGAHERYQWRLYLNCGPAGPPCIKLKIKAGNTEVAGVTWGVDDWISGRWVVETMRFERVDDHPDDIDINNAEVQRQFYVPQCESVGRPLWCLKLQVQGQSDRFLAPSLKDADTLTRDQKATIKAVWKDRAPYNIRVWFIAPRKSLEAECLNVFRDLFDQRVTPFAFAEDCKGRVFVPGKHRYQIPRTINHTPHQGKPQRDSRPWKHQGTAAYGSDLSSGGNESRARSTDQTKQAPVESGPSGVGLPGSRGLGEGTSHDEIHGLGYSSNSFSGHDSVKDTGGQMALSEPVFGQQAISWALAAEMEARVEESCEDASEDCAETSDMEESRNR